MSGSNNCLAVDVSLLAILIALHLTKRDKNLELVVMALLFTHLIMTTEMWCNSLDTALVEIPDEFGGEEELIEEEQEEQVEEEQVEEEQVEEQEEEQEEDLSAPRVLAKSRNSFFEQLFPQ